MADGVDRDELVKGISLDVRAANPTAGVNSYWNTQAPGLSVERVEFGSAQVLAVPVRRQGHTDQTQLGHCPPQFFHCFRDVV